MTNQQKTIKYCAIVFAILLIISIFSGIAQVASSIFAVFFKGSDVIEKNEIYEIFEEETVKNLDITMGASVLKIKKGEAFSVESNHSYLSVRVKNGTLVIEDKTPFYVNNKEELQVILTVPEGFSFDLAEMEIGAGNFTVEALSAKKLRMELGAGETVFENLVVTDEAEIQAGVGKFSILDGKISDLDFNVGVGDVSVTAKLSDECEFDCGIGNTEVFLIGSKEDYTVSVHKGLASATVDGKSVSNDEKIGNGSIHVEINGGIGDIRVCLIEKE